MFYEPFGKPVGGILPGKCRISCMDRYGRGGAKGPVVAFGSKAIEYVVAVIDFSVLCVWAGRCADPISFLILIPRLRLRLGQPYRSLA